MKTSRRSFILTIAIVSTVCFWSPPIYAKILTVSPGEASIQTAIEDAEDGDTVLLDPGIYFESIDTLGKAITITSLGGAGSTVIDAQGQGPVVTCVNGETNETRIDGLTLTGGSGSRRSQGDLNFFGGGVYCSGAAPTIINCVIEGNSVISNQSTFSAGGGIHVDDHPFEHAVIRDNMIVRNFAGGNGGGLSIRGSAVIEGNVISENECGVGDGGGILSLTFMDPVTIRNNLFLQNKANDHGGGLAILSQLLPAGATVIEGNLFIRNEARGSDNLGAPGGAGGAVWAVQGVIIRRNTVAFNKASTQSGEFAPTGGILLQNPSGDTVVSFNLIYHNQSGGLGIHFLSTEYSPDLPRRVADNLIFENGPRDVAVSREDVIPMVLATNVPEDPLFCIRGSESRGEIADHSPALIYPRGVIGAVDYGSCPGGVAIDSLTAVERLSWGAIKARFREL